MQDIAKELAAELGCKEEYVRNVIALLDSGSTIPFIARYRKEAHGSMDDTTLRRLEERLTYLRSLNARREEILKIIEERKKLTPEIAQAVNAAGTLSELEDIYRPFKQKRRTRASAAREKGLEPLAALLFSQKPDLPAPEVCAIAYTDAETGMENGIRTAQDALNGASDIIAEDISDNADLRKALRRYVISRGTLCAKAVSDEDSVYRQYYDFKQPIRRVKDHQVLAINRGEREKFLKVSVSADREQMNGIVERAVVRKNSPASAFAASAARDSLNRLLFPSIERDILKLLTDKACEGAIRNFALNLRPLLMQPPVKGHVTLGLDPGYRMGCKAAVVDETGKVLDTAVVYPTHGERKKAECIRILGSMIRKYSVEHIAIGNGTASRETEAMAAELIAGINAERRAAQSSEQAAAGAGAARTPGLVSYAIVNEAGASVYSASELAAKEFPDFDVNLRSAVSIARRLQDPLAELVKIDPRAIGVGQYQHDMPQKELHAALSATVEDCVNAVGVDVNTASASLLTYVSGINSTIAANILKYREENGAFTSRAELKKVPRMGPKAYEQCAGFLRVPESRDVLDHTGVHPESYPAARQMLKILNISIESGTGAGSAVSRQPAMSAAAHEPNSSRTAAPAASAARGQGSSGTSSAAAAADANGHSLRDLPERVRQYGEEKLAAQIDIGVPTLRDIARELSRPGRDPRDDLPPVLLRKDVLDISDLKPGMKLAGTVRNVIDFGVFVDIGVHQDGLVHISEISEHYIRHPSEVLRVGDTVQVVVLGVDEKKKRISLSIKQAANT